MVAPGLQARTMSRGYGNPRHLGRWRFAEQRCELWTDTLRSLAVAVLSWGKLLSLREAPQPRTDLREKQFARASAHE